jgi:hypothetical protein
MPLHADDICCRAAAYHESAHIFIACFLGLPVNPKGIRIDGFANGTAWFRGATDDSVVACAEVGKVVLALFAGRIAHSRVFANVQDACRGDERRIEELMDAHRNHPEASQIDLELLRGRAQELVGVHWHAIERIAESLWNKPWEAKPRHQSLRKEKALSGSELVPIVAPIHVVIDERVV